MFELELTYEGSFFDLADTLFLGGYNDCILQKKGGKVILEVPRDDSEWVIKDLDLLGIKALII